MIIGGQSYSVLAGVTVTSYLPKKRLSLQLQVTCQKNACRYSYKLLAKKCLPLQLQVTVLKSLAIRVTLFSLSYKLQYILVTIEKG